MLVITIIALDAKQTMATRGVGFFDSMRVLATVAISVYVQYAIKPSTPKAR